jgi:two-component SAPR family response regulator
MIMSKMIKTIENKDDYEKREGMPKMNGFELYNEIRRIDDKVCFITAFDIYTKR